MSSKPNPPQSALEKFPTPGMGSTLRTDIQALRGLAVLLVLLFHAWPALLPGGFVGVDIFFVVSGYLITGLLVVEHDQQGRIGLPAFYARRVRRLLPAASLVIAATALAFALVRSAFEARESVAGVVAAALYVSNLRLAWRSVDYLAEAAQADPLLHTWSLGVEEQFYLLWPLLLVLLARRMPARRAAAWLSVLVGVASLAAAIALTPVLQSWAFFGLPTRAWEFAAGAAAWLLRPRLQSSGLSLRGRTATGLAAAGLAMMVGSALLYSARTPFPGTAALLPVLGACLALVFGASGAGRPRFNPLHWPLLQALGDRSYSLYLWHWPVLLLAAELWPAVPRQWIAGAGLALSLLLADLSWRWVENPVRLHPRLRARTGLSLAGGLTLALLAAAAGAVAPVLAPTGSDQWARRKAEFAIRDRPRLYDDRCFAPALAVDPPPCIYGGGNGRPSVVLFGDSHAAQWLPALEELARAKDFRVAVFVKAACPVALVEPLDPKLGRPYVECTQWREQVLTRIEALRPALVVAASASSYQALVGMPPDETALRAWHDGLTLSLRRLAAAAPHVLLLRDTPLPAAHVPRCLAREAAAGRDPRATCRFVPAALPATRALALERAAAAAVPGVALADLNAHICPRQPCPIEQQGVIAFHDAEHLSASLARRLAPALWLQLPAAAQAAVAAAAAAN